MADPTYPLLVQASEGSQPALVLRPSFLSLQILYAAQTCTLFCPLTERERERAAAAAAVGVTSSALHPWPKTDASEAFITAPAFCHVFKGLSLYALLILYTLSSEHIEYIVLLDNSEH
jgi:hypothetical protein